MRKYVALISGAMPMPAARLEVAGLSAGYGPTQIVQNITFDVPAGGRLAILGRNGVGKTTVVNACIGIARGVMTLLGMPIMG